jgi:hypothetical protein
MDVFLKDEVKYRDKGQKSVYVNFPYAAASLIPKQRRVWRVLLQFCAAQNTQSGLKLFVFSLAKPCICVLENDWPLALKRPP